MPREVCACGGDMVMEPQQSGVLRYRCVTCSGVYKRRIREIDRFVLDDLCALSGARYEAMLRLLRQVSHKLAIAPDRIAQVEVTRLLSHFAPIDLPTKALNEWYEQESCALTTAGAWGLPLAPTLGQVVTSLCRRIGRPTGVVSSLWLRHCYEGEYDASGQLHLRMHISLPQSIICRLNLRPINDTGVTYLAATDFD